MYHKQRWTLEKIKQRLDFERGKRFNPPEFETISNSDVEG